MQPEFVLLNGCVRGCRIIADFDDLLFDGDVSAYPFVLGGRVSKQRVMRMQLEYRRIFALADGFTVATPALGEALRPWVDRKPIEVVRNGLSEDWLSLPQCMVKPWQDTDDFVIRYFAGSASHDADFRRILPVLQRIMREDRRITLDIIGQVHLPEGVLPQPQVTRQSLVPFNHLPTLIASAWCTIAPLYPSRFNRAKSAIKFLESAAWGTPCIASWHDDMNDCLPGGY